MASQVWERFATQVDAELLAELRSLARDEGRQIQALVDEALAVRPGHRGRRLGRRSLGSSRPKAMCMPKGRVA